VGCRDGARRWILAIPSWPREAGRGELALRTDQQTMQRRLLLILFVIGAGAYVVIGQRPAPVPPVESGAAGESDALRRAFEGRRSNVQVHATGTVERILPDDDRDSRHQRFIVRLANGQSLLIAHNIDLAARVDALAIGDSVSFSGEYEWNERGGVVHWTHHDPDGRHVPGWLEHRGRRYQ
jgi:Protein of unknown function (DUF3465)